MWSGGDENQGIFFMWPYIVHLKCHCHENFDIFFIALLKYSNVYEYFDVYMSNIRAREVDEFSV